MKKLIILLTLVLGMGLAEVQKLCTKCGRPSNTHIHSGADLGANGNVMD